MRTEHLWRQPLNWAVAKAEGLLAFGYRIQEGHFEVKCSTGDWSVFEPDRDQVLGGRIIDRERIGILPSRDGNGWEAGTAWEFFESESFAYHRHGGDTRLVAGLRCFVSRRLGDEVDVPEDLA